MTLLSNLSIKWRISLGFVLISCFVLIISAIALVESARTLKNFTQYQQINNEATQMLAIDNSVIHTQRAVQEYVHTGYQAVAEKAKRQLSDLSDTLAMLRPNLSASSDTETYLNKMTTHLENYSRTFEFAVEEIKNGKVFLQTSQIYFKSIADSGDTPADIRNKVLDINNNLYSYLFDPDLQLVTSSLNQLDQLIDLSTSDLKERLIHYKRQYLNVIQSKRGHLFLVTVVMAGEAQEFQYVSSKLKNRILADKEVVSTQFRDVISRTHSIIVATSTILILLALALAYLITRSIIRPLDQITRTFQQLADNQRIDKIPGIHLKDEIGTMSRAADTFRLNDEKNKILARELSIERSNLERSNKELEQFARITSHDLQEPLRTISSFVQLFDKQYQDVLDEKGLKYLSFINEASNRMRSLIHDVLEYSRIGKTGDLELIDINTLVEDILKDLHAAVQSKGATVSVGRLISTMGNALEVRSLFMNLVSNGLKFVPEERKPLVEIGCNIIDGLPVYYVRDNGIGIDSAQRDKAFMIFQRMQDRKTYPGNGIGLAHCKKIVESHNGKIWFESSEGKGCTFFFTLGGQAWTTSLSA